MPLDDEEEVFTPCPRCKGRGTDRYGDDCDACGGLGECWG